MNCFGRNQESLTYFPDSTIIRITIHKSRFTNLLTNQPARQPPDDFIPASNRRVESRFASLPMTCCVTPQESNPRLFKHLGMAATLWSAAVFRRFCGKREHLSPSTTTPIQSGGAPPHSTTQAKLCAWNDGHVVECGSVLPLLSVRQFRYRTLNRYLP